MSLNWMRYFELILEVNQDNFLRLSDFKVSFTITTSVNSNGSTANITLYNLSPSTRNAIMNGVYKRLKVIAGYAGPTVDIIKESDVGKSYPVEKSGQIGGRNYGEIFSGDLRFAYIGESGKGADNTLVIQAIDGHQAEQEAIVTATVAAGYDARKIYELTLRSFHPYGITGGVTGEMPTTRYPRGRVLYQKASQVIGNVAEQCRASWQFVDGKLQLVPEENYLEQIITLNSQSGLISTPTLTTTGIEINCLINPDIRLHGLIHINQAALKRMTDEIKLTEDRNKGEENNKPAGSDEKKASSEAAQKKEEEERKKKIATDGVYIVKGITYSGDTRGTEWNMKITGIVRDQQKSIKASAEK